MCVVIAKAGEVLWKAKSFVCVIKQISHFINNTYLCSLTFTLDAFHVDCISLNHHLVKVASTEILLFSLSMIIQLTFSNSSLSF